MKNFSDNIKPVAGLLALKNLNVFPGSGEPDCVDYTKPWVDSFREAVGRTAILASKAFSSDSAGGSPGQYSLAQLSVPRFEVLGEGRYRLTGGIFLWASHLFTPGATFRVQGNDLQFETPDLIQPATAVPAKMEEMKYDTYNASRLGEISDEVLKELDITLDKSALAYAYLEEGQEGKSWEELEEEGSDSFIEGFSQVKYMSIYAEGLTGNEIGRVIAYQASPADASYATPELGFDAAVFSELVDSWKGHYDQFLVEFVDPAQPFAYIAIEMIGRPALAARPELEKDDFRQLDAFAEMFNPASKDELAKHDPAEIVETLRRIGAGEA